MFSVHKNKQKQEKQGKANRHNSTQNSNKQTNKKGKHFKQLCFSSFNRSIQKT